MNKLAYMILGVGCALGFVVVGRPAVDKTGPLVVVSAERDGSALTLAQGWKFSRTVSGYWGSGYYHCLVGDESVRAEWTVVAPDAGVVTVAGRWTSDANRTSCARVVIAGADGGPVEVAVDQTKNGGEWVPLANVRVDGRTRLHVVLEGREMGKQVVANAVALFRPSLGFDHVGVVYGTQAADNPFLKTMNIAPWSRVSARSWLENMTPDMLVDGDTRFIYRKTGWCSGTRFPAATGIWREESLEFDFGRTEPSLIEGVQVFSRDPVVFAVDVSDGKAWRQVADNRIEGRWPQRISFPVTPAYSVRVRLLRNTRDDATEHYLLGEVRIYGRLRGESLRGNDTGDLLCQTGDWTAEAGSALRGALVPVRTAHAMTVDATLTRPVDGSVLDEVYGVPAGAGASFDFGLRPAGAYRVRLVLRDATSGAVVERKTVEAGVRDPDWARGEVAAYVGGEAAYRDKTPPTDAFFRSADINGLDSPQELGDVDFYVREVAKAGAVAEFHLNWRSLEPLPGVYDFDFADRLFGAAVKQGVFFKFVLNPPLTGYVPDFLKGHRMEAQYRDGHRETVDMVSLASPLVSEHARRLFDLLFKRYGRHPAALMWVLNVNGEYLWRLQNPKYEDASGWALAGYRRFLEKRYATISKLNSRWRTTFRGFDEVERPSFGANPAWTDFCDYMMTLTADFYRPVVSDARRLTHAGTILAFTAGHQAAEPISSLAREYDVWQSNHSQENPQFIGWAEIWRSLGVPRFGEPGFVNIEPLDVNRAFFINAVCGARMYTYRQYNWPNQAAWLSFSRQQVMGDLLAGAEPMRVPLTLVSTYESGLVGAANSFSVGGTWDRTGAFYNALLKRGAIASYYNGHNPCALAGAKVVIDLGSQAWTDAEMDALVKAAERGAHVKVLLSVAGRRFRWGEFETGEDVLLAKLQSDGNAAKLAATQGGRGPRRVGMGSVEFLAEVPPLRAVPGNNRRDVGGTGWNVQYTSPELMEQLDAWVAEACADWPFRFESDGAQTWVCGFTGKGGRRFVLLYNNDGTRAVKAKLSALSRRWFPAEHYRLIVHTLDSALEVGMVDRDGGEADIEVAPYGVTLMELVPRGSTVRPAG